MGICRWEWFGFRRLPFEDALLNRRNSRQVAGAGAAAAAGGNRRKQEEIGGNRRKKYSSFSLGFRSYIREFLGAILMLFRPSLPWGFATGSGLILGYCLLKMSF